ncbi:MAG: glycosyltransferase [Candidatus Micrarchaeota archaeon]
MPRLTIIIPAYNEERSIVSSIGKLADYIKKNKLDCELLVINDCSSDETVVVLALAKLPSYARIITTAKREGRGASISNAIRAARGSVVLYLDADISFELDIVQKLVQAIDDGADIATGSRLLPSSKAKRSFLRSFLSTAYNLLVRLMLGSRIHDHQCGCKAFRRSTVLPLLQQVRANHWFWDTELLVLAQKKGLKVVELPLAWWEGEYTTVNVLRDSLTLFQNIFALKFRTD